MNKFKVGDKVRLKEKNNNTYGLSKKTLEKLKKLNDTLTINSIRIVGEIILYTLKEDIKRPILF